MAFTRFKYDDCRTKKSLQQATDPGRWILNVPGNGSDLPYIEDPQIIIQKWGANLRTNTIQLESDLKGVNRTLNKDCLGKNEYRQYQVANEPVAYPTCKTQFTEQSRATNPAWWYRDVEQNHFSYLPIDPQLNTCMPFQNNVSSRIIEKDMFTSKREFALGPDNQMLPTSLDLIKDTSSYYVGGPTLCTPTHSCQRM